MTCIVPPASVNFDTRRTGLKRIDLKRCDGHIPKSSDLEHIAVRRRIIGKVCGTQGVGKAVDGTGRIGFMGVAGAISADPSRRRRC